jgi:hypothetical protein
LENTILIDYRGSIKYETIGELIHKFKQQVPRFGIPIGIYKRILLVMIETLENIMKHSVSHSYANTDENLPSLCLYKDVNQFVITSSNPLKVKDIPVLKTRIDYLNNLDHAGLKSVYKETITDGVFTNTGGAGLGLIEIVKISGNPIKYEFKPVDQFYALYIQQVFVNK